MHGSSLSDSQVLESRLREHLGLPMGPRLALGPKPLPLYSASLALAGIALVLFAVAVSTRLVTAVGLTAGTFAAGSAAFLLLRRRQRFFLTPFERGRNTTRILLCTLCSAASALGRRMHSAGS